MAILPGETQHSFEMGPREEEKDFPQNPVLTKRPGKPRKPGKGGFQQGRRGPEQKASWLREKKNLPGGPVKIITAPSKGGDGACHPLHQKKDAHLLWGGIKKHPPPPERGELQKPSGGASTNKHWAWVKTSRGRGGVSLPKPGGSWIMCQSLDK